MQPLRFLFVGRFTQAPKGARITVSGERMADVMARLDLRAGVDVVDRLGTATTRHFELELGSARALRAADVWANCEPLRSLAEVASALVRPQGPIALGEAIRRVAELVGDGPLCRALAALEAPAPAPAPAPTPTPPRTSPAAPAPAPASTGSSPIDAIFAQAELPSPDTITAARSGVDAFVATLRKHRAEGTSASSSGPLNTRAAALVLDAIEATAADALAQPLAAGLEAAWRGIKLVLGESPGHAQLAIELLDTTATELLDALQHAIDTNPPDAVFVLDAPADLSLHAALAAVGEQARLPMVVTLDPAALDAGPAPLSAWLELRRDPRTAWLCAVTNDVVLLCESTRVGPRVVFGTPVFAIAAMLAASLRRDGTFGDAFGRAGALVGPASYAVDAGRGTTRNQPTRAMLEVGAMRAMGDQGITVLGAEPGGERLVAVGAPMVASVDAPGLAGQILVGRAVRAAISARDELTLGATGAELEQALLRASSQILPDGPPGTCALRGRSEGAQLAIDADFRAAATGRAFSARFHL